MSEVSIDAAALHQRKPRTVLASLSLAAAVYRYAVVAAAKDRQDRRVSLNVVFVHGAGLAGADAWPDQTKEAEGGWFFLPRFGIADGADLDANRILDRLKGTRGGHVVAHSYGANAALLAAQREPELVRSLALLEPACFDLARGQTAVEEHIAAMTAVFAVADDRAVGAREFSRRFAEAMGFDAPDLPDDELEANVSRLRALSPPWDIGLQLQLSVRTLVLTGGARPLYEQTAASLVELGARHEILDGAGHRVQDHPRCTSLLRSHWSE